jgi:hypothetical protein
MSDAEERIEALRAALREVSDRQRSLTKVGTAIDALGELGDEVRELGAVARQALLADDKARLCAPPRTGSLCANPGHSEACCG